MRRPRFKRWIRSQVLLESGLESFSLRKAAWVAQHHDNDRLAAALLLYAHESEVLDKLSVHIHDDVLAAEYREVERHLGRRSIERLALHGAILGQLPASYRRFLEEYRQAYHMPETVAHEKECVSKRCRALFVTTGITVTELASDLDLDRGNMHAFLVRGDVGRFTLETAQQIETYLVNAPTPVYSTH